MQLGQLVSVQKVLAARAVAASAEAIAVDPRAKIDTDGKTVNQVYGALWACLSHTEMEPEWLCLANTRDHPDEYAYGARHGRMWPSRYQREFFISQTPDLVAEADAIIDVQALAA
jgi:hypothetical protein